MYVQDDAIEHNGTAEKTAATTHEVSLWYIPGGCDYVNAMEVKFYFESEVDANAYQKLYHMPPEMAFVSPVQQAA